MLYIRVKYKHYKFIININTIDTSLRFLFKKKKLIERKKSIRFFFLLSLENFRL